MNLRYVTKKIKLTARDKADIEKHFEKLEKMLKEPYTITCAVEKKPNNQIKLELTVDEKKLYRIEAYASTLENVVDDVERRMYRILRKAKEKHDEFDNTSIKQYEDQSTEEKYTEKSTVSKVKRFPIKPCSVEDAIVAMLETDHDFYVFRNEETDSNDVVYIRKDGSIGLIQLV